MPPGEDCFQPKHIEKAIDPSQKLTAVSSFHRVQTFVLGPLWNTDDRPRYSADLPYRIDIASLSADTLDVLVDLGALDIQAAGGGVAAILPDSVTPERVKSALGLTEVQVSEAVARDSGSVWLLGPRAIRIGSVAVIPAEETAPTGAVLRLTDSHAFGTGHHPTTAMCLEALEESLLLDDPDSVLDVGTGSGVLALAALLLGVQEAVGLDTDAGAIKIAAENARLNNLADRLRLVQGGPEVVDGTWPVVVANVLAAPLIELAHVLVRRVGQRGRLILSGIPCSLEMEVRQAYQHCGMRHLVTNTRAGWVVLMMMASW